MSWRDGISLDLKLGGRMLVKYPGLTIVGGLAMAFAICAGTVIFAVLTMLVDPTLPVPAGERLVEIRNWDTAANRPEPRASSPGFLLIAAAGSVETDMPGLTGELSLGQFAILIAYTGVMFGVCLLACVVPARRALGVEPTIALRTE